MNNLDGPTSVKDSGTWSDVAGQQEVEAPGDIEMNEMGHQEQQNQQANQVVNQHQVCIKATLNQNSFNFDHVIHYI